MQGVVETVRASRGLRLYRPVLAASAIALGALLPSTRAFAAPAVGERYLVAGRCVTLERIVAGQAYYAWNEGSRSGSGNLPASALGARCQAQAAAGAAPAEGAQDDPAHMAQPPAQPPAPPAGTGTTTTTSPVSAGGAAADSEAAFRDEILRAHNRVRCMHGAPPLSWHPEVAAYAQNWVRQSGFSHSKSYASPLGPMGENLYGSSGLPGAAAAVGDWYGESRGYNYAGEGASASGHFTALIWKDAKYLGCGRANGKISCNYWAGSQAKDCTVPNMQGCYRAEVQPPARDEAACR